VSILVVDDEDAITEVVSEYLRTRGLQVDVASDGEQALARIQQGGVHVVLSDLRMPVRGGMSLLESIVEHRLRVATIVMTGFGTVETATQALKLGAVDYLLKPVRLRDLYDAVLEALQLYQARRESDRVRLSVKVYEQLLELHGPVDPTAVLLDFAELACFLSQGSACRLELREGGQWRAVKAAGHEGEPSIAVGAEQGLALSLWLAEGAVDDEQLAFLERLLAEIQRRLVEAGADELPEPV